MQIVYRRTDELIPYERNQKRHDERQIQNVANSIKRFGWQQPIVIDKKDVVVIGHARLLAAKKLGLKEVPVTVADDLTEDEVRELRIVDNKTNESPWDFELLDIDLQELSFDGFDFDYDSAISGDIEQSDARLDEGESDEFDEEPPLEPKSKRGEVYALGEHRLMCGDSSSREDFEKLMRGEKANAVFTDPPYGVAIGDKNATLNSVQPSGRCTTNIAGDTITEDELYSMLKSAFENVRENCRDDASYYVTSPQGGSLGMMMMMMKDAGLPVKHVLMWMKNCATFSLGRLDYDYQHEPMFYTWTKSHKNYRKSEFRTTVWQVDKPRKCDMHPTMKPVRLVENVLLDATQEGEIVLDAFGGSGTTIIAAENLNRKARVMEYDPKYVDVIIIRWETLTGKKAVLLND